MSDRYQLLFRGELLEGQHKAVVKKKLSGLLKMDAAQTDGLFSASTVIIKKDVDRATAARYQAAFKKSGARLRVVKVPGSGAAAEVAPAGGSAPLDGPPAGFTVAEVGSLLNDVEPAAAPPPPDTSHISVAALGSDLLDQDPDAVAVDVEIDPSWALAEAGTDLGQILPEQVVVELNPDFDLAPAGADMDERERPAPPPPPDTSHMRVERVEESEG